MSYSSGTSVRQELTPLRSSTNGFSAMTDRSASAVTRSTLVSSMTPVDRHDGGQLAAHRTNLGPTQSNVGFPYMRCLPLSPST